MIRLIQRLRPITRDGDLFYRYGTTGLADALQATETANLEPQYAPEFANYRSNAPSDENLWNNCIITPSIRATGRTKAGTKVVVYAHVPNHYSNHEHLRAAVEGKTLRNGVGALPQDEFQRLVDLDGQTDNQDVRRVWVVDYDTLRRAPSGSLDVNRALEHPLTIPFLGSEAGAQAYLTAHTTAYHTEKIGVWRSDDFDETSARARLLLFGNDVIDGLDGNYLNNLGRFLGVAPEAPSRANNTPLRPTLQQIVARVGRELPGVDVTALEQTLGPLYQE